MQLTGHPRSDSHFHTRSLAQSRRSGRPGLGRELTGRLLLRNNLVGRFHFTQNAIRGKNGYFIEEGSLQGPP
jgi:hypothetical protein